MRVSAAPNLTPRLAARPVLSPLPVLRKPVVMPISDNIAVAPAGGGVRVDIHGAVYGNRITAMLSRADALQLIQALTTACKSA